jgi:hypothetical protein
MRRFTSEQLAILHQSLRRASEIVYKAKSHVGHAMVAQCDPDELPEAITEAIQDAWHDGYMEGQKVTDPWSENNDK